MDNQAAEYISTIKLPQLQLKGDATAIKIGNEVEFQLGVRKLIEELMIQRMTEVEFLPEDITDSPIMGEKNAWGVFVGLVRSF